MREELLPASEPAEEPYRRRYVRVDIAVPVTFARDGEDAPKAGYTSDLGGGGTRLSSDEDLPLGTVLLLRFQLPARASEMVARGRIVLSFYDAQAKRYLHGIAFTQIDPRDQEELIAFVAVEVQRQAHEVLDEST